MGSDYRRIDDGYDADEVAWEIGVMDGDVIVRAELDSLRLDGERRDEFIRTFAEAERQAEAHGADRTCRYCGGEIQPCTAARSHTPRCKGWLHAASSGSHYCESLNPHNPAAEPLSAEAVR